MLSRELEWELEGEFEDEHEGECELEGECEFEGEYEGEAFFRQLAQRAARAAAGAAAAARRGATYLRQQAMTPGSPLRRAGLASIRSGAPRLLGQVGGAIGRRYGGDVGGGIGADIGGWFGDTAVSLLPDQEFEFEDEAILNPADRAFRVATLSHLGQAAAGARTEAEAEAFLGALIPLAAQLIPRVAPAVMRAAPSLIRGVANVGRTLLRSPATRPLVRAVPGIVRGTVTNLARQAAQGRPITAASAARTLAGQTYRTLATPGRARAAVAQNRALDRRYHQRAGGCTCR